MTKRTYILSAFLLWAFMLQAARDTTEMRIVDISRIDTTIRLVYDLPLRRPATDYQITLQPAVVGQSDTLLLEPIVLQGKNMIRQLHRDHVLNHKDEEEPDYYPQRLRVNVLRDTMLLPLSEYRWLMADTVALCRMSQVKEGCCKVVEQDDECSEPFSYFEEKMQELPTEKQVASFVPIVAALPQEYTLNTIENTKMLVPRGRYMPYLRTEVLSRREDVLCVYYELDSITLKRNFRKNYVKLDTIVNAINTMLADTMAEIRTIQIIGLASVEGSIAHNEWLARERGKALKKYIIQETGVADSLFEVNNGGEAWAEFAWQIENSDFIGKNRVMKILKDSTIWPERKEELIKRMNGGRTYDYIRNNLLADQRNAGYIRVYYDLLTDSAAVAINTAVELIKAHNYDEALEVLLPFKDDKRTHEAIGVAYYMIGNTEEAERYWGKDLDEGQKGEQKEVEKEE